jgi:uncharacterized protein YjbI with pentapeptide repeats
MANEEHRQRLLSGDWNRWRAENPSAVPDLEGADLRSADFSSVTFAGAKLWGARVGKTAFPAGALHWKILLTLAGGFMKPKTAGRR